MEKEYLSIREYAEICGVSYNAIYKRLNKNLQPYVEEVKGHKMLKIEVLEAENLTSNFNELKKNSSTNSKIFNQSSTNENTDKFNIIQPFLDEEIKRINKQNEEIIKALRAEIKEKDDTIKEQTKQIIDLSNRMADITENNQKLQLSYQLLLAENNKVYTESEEEVEPETAPAPQTIEQEQKQEQKQERRSIFKRLFRAK